MTLTMKNTYPSLHKLILCVSVVFLLASCTTDQVIRTTTYEAYTPVYMSYNELRASVAAAEVRELKNPGKLYFYNTYVLISEIDEGIHVIDNRDPSNPEFVSFINIPGNHDLAVRGNTLYADSYIDLVAIDISDPQNPVEVDREEEVFPFFAWFNGFQADPELGVVVDWQLDTITVRTEGGNTWYHGRSGFLTNDLASFSQTPVVRESTFSNAGGTPDVQTGIGGSLARFTIINDYMYAVTDQELISFNINNLDNPVEEDRLNIGWQIETIFPFGDKLLIGSQFGMFIYDIEVPSSPVFVSEFQHVRSCDPVVAEGDYAYVTLRDGNPCRNGQNQLDVLDISTIENPRLIASYDMVRPNGLGIRNGTLFVCDEDGLKVYDASNPSQIDQNRIARFARVRAMDVIPLYNLLLVIGEDGFAQYDYSDLENIELISEIPVVRD